MKKILLICFAILISANIFSQTTLSKGDVLVVAISTGDEQFAFTTLVDLQENTIIYFTDEEADGDTSISPGDGEGTIIYTAPSGGISAGTVITVDTDGSTANTSHNAGSGGGMALGNSGDGLLVYQGNSVGSVTTFIHAMGEDSGDIGTFPASTLTSDDYVLIGADDGSYSGSTSGFKADIISNVNNSSNWTVSGSASINPVGSFTVSNSITSNQSGNWNTSSTWVGGSVPTANDEAIIANTHTVNVISSSGVADRITVNSGGKLRIYQTLTVDDVSSNAGTLNINSGGKLIISAGNFTNSGTLTIAKGRQMTMADGTTLTNSGSISLTSDSNEFGSLLLNGTYTKSGSGTVTYGRFVSGVSNNWDLIGAPVSGQDAADFISNNGDIAENSGDYGIGPYDNSTNSWSTWSTVDAITNGNLTSGVGYQMANGGAGAAMEFTGDINAGTVNVSVINNDAANSGNGTRFNLVANPYPSFINANSNAGTNNFIGTNGSSGNAVLMAGAFNCLYAWGGSSYTTINQASAATYIAPGQGFMIAAESSSAANLSFTANMQTTSGSDDFISGQMMNDDRAELFISLTQDDLNRRTEFYFINDVTDGLDVGYDSSVYEFATNTIFSRLLADDDGMNLAIQSLAYSEMWDKVIPIGINALGGEEMNISISHRTTPADLNIYLEDTEEGTMTNLLEGDFIYTPTSDLEGVGRFFIHMTADTMSNEEVSTSMLNAYKEIDASYITIEGLATQSNETKVSLYNILGREVLSTTLNNNMGTQTISTVGLSAGIYVIELESGSDRLTKKLLIQ